MRSFLLLCLCCISVAMGAHQEEVQESEWHNLLGNRPLNTIDEPDASPAGRGNAAIWCTDTDAIYLFGGRTQDGRTNDLWRFEEEADRWLWIDRAYLDNRTWHPPAVSGAVFWAAPGDRHLWLYGGRDDDGRVSDQMWRYDTGHRSWEHILEGSASPSPGPRFGATFWYRAGQNQLFLYGGNTNDTDVVLGDLWVFDTKSLVWSLVQSDPDPGPLEDASAALVNGVVYLFGGENEKDHLGSNALWRLELDALVWSTVGADGAPAPREDHSLWYDPSLDALILFGGKTQDGTVSGHWHYSIRDNAWRKPETRDEPPSPRWGAALCQDPEGYGFLVGGVVGDGEQYLNDVWKHGQRERFRDILFEDLDRNTTATYLAAAMSTILFVMCLVFLLVLSIRSCLKKRDMGHTELVDL